MMVPTIFYQPQCTAGSWCFPGSWHFPSSFLFFSVLQQRMQVKLGMALYHSIKMEQRSEISLRCTLWWRHPSTHAGSLCWLFTHLQHAQASMRTPAYCTHSSLTLHQHAAYGVEADAWIIPTETREWTHLLPTAVVRGGGLAGRAIHVFSAHDTHGPQSLHTRTCAGLYIPLTGWNKSSCLTALTRTQSLGVCSMHPASSTQKYPCFLKITPFFLKVTRTGLGHMLMQVSEHSHFLCLSVCVHTIYRVNTYRACYIHAAPWIYTGNNHFASSCFRPYSGLFTPKAYFAFLFICNVF